MKLVKKNTGTDVRVVLFETPTHFICADLGTTFLGGTDQICIYAAPRTGYTETGTFDLARPGAEVAQ